MFHATWHPGLNVDTAAVLLAVGSVIAIVVWYGLPSPPRGPWRFP